MTLSWDETRFGGPAEELAYTDERDQPGVYYETMDKVRAQGVKAIISPATSFASNAVNKEKLRTFPNIFFAVGIHPKYLPSFPGSKYKKDIIRANFQQMTNYYVTLTGITHEVEKMLDEVEKMAANAENVCAIGETGLDYHIPNLSEEQKALQVSAFRKQILIALHHRLPLVLHIRDGEDHQANEDAIRLLRSFHCQFHGSAHCFCSDYDTAMAYISMGFGLGIGGTITFSGADKLRDAVSRVPLESILLETDSPYVTPIGVPEERNSPFNIPYIADQVIKLRKEEPEKIITTIWNNSLRQFPKLSRIK